MLKKKALKKKFKENYSELKKVCLRYGINDEYFTKIYIQYKDLSLNNIKHKLIINWLDDHTILYNEKSNNVFIDALYELEDIERIIFNLRCIDLYSNESIKDLLKININLINKYYKSAKQKIESNEKVTNYLNNLNKSN